MCKWKGDKNRLGKAAPPPHSMVVTETVFSLPGIGRLVVQSILRRDYPVIQGVILVIVVLYMTINLLVDLAYARLDPRVSLK